MKRSLFLLITAIFASHTMSQILYDGMYSNDWEAERDALVFYGQNSEQQQWIQEQERKRQEQERAIQNLRIEIPSQHQSASPKGMSQAEYNRRIAEKNRQIAIRNKQIQQRNQQLALQRRQQQIAAEKRKQEEIRIQREREQQKREETRQRVAEETYQRLESQTRTLQNAAAYASGEGAYRLREQHDVSRYETPIRQGTGNIVNQIDYSTKQKFTTPSNSVFIDPSRQSNLGKWDENRIVYPFENTNFVRMQYSNEDYDSFYSKIEDFLDKHYMNTELYHQVNNISSYIGTVVSFGTDAVKEVGSFTKNIAGTLLCDATKNLLPSKLVNTSQRVMSIAHSISDDKRNNNMKNIGELHMNQLGNSMHLIQYASKNAVNGSSRIHSKQFNQFLANTQKEKVRFTRQAMTDNGVPKGNTPKEMFKETAVKGGKSMIKKHIQEKYSFAR